MEKIFIALIQRVYLIKRINSLLCTISFFLIVILISQNPGSIQKSNYWLRSMLGLLLLSELILLTIYTRISFLNKRKRLNIFPINSRGLIICTWAEIGKIKLGNLGLLDRNPIFKDLSCLIWSRFWGISAALLMITSVLLDTKATSSFIFFLAINLMLALKREKEGFNEKLAHNEECEY
ncbi:MAG: hypothetical protein PHH52_02645 [Patescibacteria group bacterium]|nr:hypothetical protein [Patescibacteria group bacterium]